MYMYKNFKQSEYVRLQNGKTDAITVHWFQKGKRLFLMFQRLHCIKTSHPIYYFKLG